MGDSRRDAGYRCLPENAWTQSTRRVAHGTSPDGDGWRSEVRLAGDDARRDQNLIELLSKNKLLGQDLLMVHPQGLTAEER